MAASVLGVTLVGEEVDTEWVRRGERQKPFGEDESTAMKRRMRCAGARTRSRRADNKSDQAQSNIGVCGLTSARWREFEHVDDEMKYPRRVDFSA